MAISSSSKIILFFFNCIPRGDFAGFGLHSTSVSYNSATWGSLIHIERGVPQQECEAAVLESAQRSKLSHTCTKTDCGCCSAQYIGLKRIERVSFVRWKQFRCPEVGDHSNLDLNSSFVKGFYKSATNNCVIVPLAGPGPLSAGGAEAVSFELCNDIVVHLWDWLLVEVKSAAHNVKRNKMQHAHTISEPKF